MQYCFSMAFSKEKSIYPGIKWAYNVIVLHNKSDLREFRRETMTVREVLSNVLGKQLGQKECIPLIFYFPSLIEIFGLNVIVLD